MRDIGGGGSQPHWKIRPADQEVDRLHRPFSPRISADGKADTVAESVQKACIRVCSSQDIILFSLVGA